MSYVPVSVQQKNDADAAFTAYKQARDNGAGTGSAPTYDDYVASKARADQAARATPMELLFLSEAPVGDPSTPRTAVASSQLADNGIKPIFLAVVQWLSTKVLVGTRIAYAVPVANGNTHVTLTNTGNLPHSTAPGIVGVPVDANPEAQYVEIRSAANGNVLTVAGGGHAGERIYGRTQVGASTSPNSVEVAFFSRSLGSDVSVGNAYTWENTQPTSVNFRYPFRMALTSADETAFRRVLE